MTPGGSVWAESAERATCKNFQGKDLGYQGESIQIDNGLW
jgi:hypothetical protein